MKDETPGLVKYSRLKRALGLRAWQATGVLESLWLFARKNSRFGDVGRFANEDIAAAMEWEGDADALIAALVESRWLDESPTECRLVCHDWIDHAPTNVIRKIGNDLGFNDPKTATLALRAAWHSKVFGSKNGESPPAPGSFSPETYPDRAEKSPDSTPLACAREPNPTQPNHTQPHPPAPGGETAPATWAAVWGELKAEGLGVADRVVEKLRNNRNNAAEALAVIERWRSFDPRPGVGLLGSKLENMREGGKVVWPAEYEQQIKSRSAQVAKESIAKHQRKLRAEERKQRELEYAEFARRNSEFGQELDDLPREEVTAIIESWGAGEAGLLLKFVPSNGPVVIQSLRDRLLRHLESVAKRPTCVFEEST